MRSYKVLGLASTVLFALAACAPMAATYRDMESPVAKDGGKDPVPAPTPVVVTKNPLWCFENRVDFELRATITSFALTGSGGVNAGFGLPIAGLQMVKLGFNYSTADLNTQMSLFQSFRSNSVADAPGTGHKDSFSFSSDFLANIGLGGNISTTTPLYQVSNDAMKSNLANIITALSKKSGIEEWSTSIFQVDGKNGFIIPVGANAGLMVGDELKVMDASYDWAGNPCESELLMTRPSGSAVATAVVDYISPDSAHLILKAPPTRALEKFNYVSISKLALGANKTKRTTLARSVRIGRVSSQPLWFQTDQGNQQIDIGTMAFNQLVLLMRDPAYSATFYLRQ